MKLWVLAAFLALCSTSPAQTLKWERVEEVNSNIGVATISQVLHDAVGNVAYLVTLEDVTGIPQTRLVWLSAAGKELHKDAVVGESTRFLRPVFVSANVLIVAKRLSSGGTEYLRYVRKGSTVTEGPVSFTAVETPVSLASFPHRNFFYTTSGGPVGTTVAIRRYSAK